MRRKLAKPVPMAGAAASRALQALMEGRAITCEPRGHDQYGRTIALCRADGRDLGADMVRAGMALAFTRYRFRHSSVRVVELTDLF
jgi:endonuclease YncB( thermonuclease family)